MLLLAAVALFSKPPPASSTGIYEDPGRLSSFVRAPRVATLASEAIRTEAPTHDASLYTLGVRLPVKSTVLMRAELSYVSLTTPTDFEDGFGDARLRARTRLAAGNMRALFLVGSFRAGSGSSRLFPYSTASTDIEGGLAMVDTLSTTTAVWVYTTGTHPTRVRDNLKNPDLYPNFLTLAGGLVLTVATRLDLQGGVLAYVFRGDEPRELYFVDLDLRYNDTTAFYASFQAEGGDEADRAVDFAAALGIRIRYR
jgi:hypothetical protein